MKILSVVGARPEFIQATPVRKALLAAGHDEIWVHTGQHYDYQMSQTFFDELGIPPPDYNLEVRSGGHGWQTGAILSRMEEVLLQAQPDLVIVRGDTNSTAAAALAAAKLHIPTAHIEAGERSYDRRMPEEINRLIADGLSDVHFCASQTAVRRLAAEGITDTVQWVGDVMFDASLQNRSVARRNSHIMEQLALDAKGFSLVTVHRASNTDDPLRMHKLVNAFNGVNERIIFPAHPRTRKAINQLDIQLADHVSLIDPVGYFDMMILEENARIIATDSGGVQREAYFMGIPCLTLRDETEWVETVETGWNVLVGADTEKILGIWNSLARPDEQPPIFGDGAAGEKIAAFLTNNEIAFGSSGDIQRAKLLALR